MIQKTFTSLIVTSLFLGACSATDQDANEKIGATTGTVIGAVIGSRVGGSLDDGSGRILGATLGAIFGAIIGKEIAKTLSEADLRRADETAQDTMETADTGQTVKWDNPDSGNSGSYTPTSERREVDGEDCRDFESSVFIDGDEQVATGRACRQPDGSWKIVQ